MDKRERIWNIIDMVISGAIGIVIVSLVALAVISLSSCKHPGHDYPPIAYDEDRDV